MWKAQRRQESALPTIKRGARKSSRAQNACGCCKAAQIPISDWLLVKAFTEVCEPYLPNVEREVSLLVPAIFTVAAETLDNGADNGSRREQKGMSELMRTP